MLYNFLILMALPFILLRLFYKSRRQPHYRRRLNERLSFGLPKALCNSWLVHTVSVGEFLALRPLLRDILQQHPTINLYLTCTTPTGSSQIQAFQAEFPDRIRHSYLPYDLPFFTKRFVRHVQPKLLVLMETELWPNLILQADLHSVPMILENARLSKKSCRAYARFAPSTMRRLLPRLHINAQHRFDAKRFVFLGARPDRITVMPNLKYHVPDSAPPPFPAPQSALLWLAASTHAPEEDVILRAHRLIQAEIPNALLYLAPRHPERRDELCQLITQHGYHAKLRSQNPQSALSSDNPNEIFVLDTLGELARFYAHSSVAFIGGSLFGRGGHNPLEAVHQGNSVCFGRDTHNFATICQELATKRFVRIVPHATPEAVRDAILNLHQHHADHHADKALYLRHHQHLLPRHQQRLLDLALPSCSEKTT